MTSTGRGQALQVQDGPGRNLDALERVGRGIAVDGAGILHQRPGYPGAGIR